MNAKLILSILMLFFGISCFSQIAGKTYTLKISGKNIFNSETGDPIQEEELASLISNNPNIIFEPVIDKYGKVDSYIVNPNRTDRIIRRDVSLRVKTGEQFLPFVMKSTTKDELNSDQLKGKYILLQFQLSFAGPLFRESTLSEFNLLAKELIQVSEVEAIVITESSKEEIRSEIQPNKYMPHIVPNGRNFNQRYLIVNFPTMALIDKKGNLVSYYSRSEMDKVKADIKKLESQ